MGGALDEFEALALNGRLRYGGHPILTWNANTAVPGTLSATGARQV
jgi:hypothetical protein